MPDFEMISIFYFSILFRIFDIKQNSAFLNRNLSDLKIFLIILQNYSGCQKRVNFS
jgi:hypothetical protein